MALYDIARGLQPLDLGRTLGQVDAMQANRLQADATREGLARERALDQAIAEFGPAAARGEESALLRLAQAGRGGYQIAAPLLREAQQNAEAQSFLGRLVPGLAPPAAPAAPAAPPAPQNTPAVAQGSPPVRPSGRGLAGVPERFRSAVEASARLRGVDPDLLANLLAQESGWNPNAVSPAGARGLGQHMPGTARELGIDPADPQQSIDGAARYLAQQLQAFGGDVPTALAAYNAGPGRTRGAIVEGRLNVAALPRETQDYITRVSGGAQPGGGQPAAAAPAQRPPLPALPEGVTPAAIAVMAASGNPRLMAAAQALAPFARQDQRQAPETWRPMTAEERTQYSVPQGTTAQISSLGQMRLPGAAQTNVTVDQRSENEEAKAFGREMGTQAATVLTAADGARSRLAQLDQLEALMGNFETGRLSPAQRTVGAWARALGISPEVLRRIGIQPGAAVNGDAMAAITNALTVSMIGPGGFPSNNFSDADRKFLQETMPQIGTDPTANRIVIQAMRAAGQRTLMQEEMWLEARSRGQSFADFRRTWNGWVRDNPLFPRPASPEEAQNLPPGMFYITPDNRLLRR